MIALTKMYVPSEPVECLFIGGPWDGRLQLLTRVELYFSVAKPISNQLSVFNTNRLPNMAHLFQKVKYRAYRFTCGPDHPGFVFYAAEPLEPVHIMQILWSTYADTAPTHAETD